MLYAVAAIAHDRAGQVINAIPGLELADEQPRLRVTKNAVTRGIFAMRYPSEDGVALPVTSNAAGGLWDIYGLQADSRDIPGAHYRWVARAMRWLRAREAAQPGWVIARSLAHLAAEHPAVWAQLEGRLPHLGGFPPAMVADYRPTDQDILDDRDPAESEVY